MPLKENQIRKKLREYSQSDIYFLKKQWREWIKKREFEKFETELQRPNIQGIYKLLEDSEILYIEPAKFERYKARIKYHKTHDLVTIFQFNDKLDRIEVVTYYAESINTRHKP